MALDMIQKRALVNTAMYLWIPYKAETKRR
jgi:hypothetical protein